MYNKNSRHHQKNHALKYISFYSDFGFFLFSNQKDFIFNIKNELIIIIFFKNYNLRLDHIKTHHQTHHHFHQIPSSQHYHHKKT